MKTKTKKMYLYSRKFPWLPMKEFEVKNDLYLTTRDKSINKFWGIATKYMLESYYYVDYLNEYKLGIDYLHENDNVFCYYSETINSIYVLSYDKDLLKACQMKECTSKKVDLEEDLESINFYINRIKGDS